MYLKQKARKYFHETESLQSNSPYAYQKIPRFFIEAEGSSPYSLHAARESYSKQDESSSRRRLLVL
jgi:hypothetical protein